jgi:hypothetical protein
MDEGMGNVLKDATLAKHTAGVVSPAWLTSSGPYCAVGGALLPETTVINAGFDIFQVPPGQYAVLARTANPLLNNNLRALYGYNDSGTPTSTFTKGSFGLSNGVQSGSADACKVDSDCKLGVNVQCSLTKLKCECKPGWAGYLCDQQLPAAIVDNITLINPQGVKVDSVNYLATGPWAPGVSMMLKDGCFDPKLNDDPNCWMAAGAACIYGPMVDKITTSLASCANTPCAAINGEVCVEFDDCGTPQQPLTCKKCVGKDQGTPGGPNVCQ